MKKLTILLSVVLMFAGLSFAQTALTSTTLAAAIADGSNQNVVVASATGISANNTALYVDREVLLVTAVNGVNLKVIRGYAGTRGHAHGNGATAYIGPNSGAFSFISFGRFGACTASNEQYLPQLVVGISSPDNGSVEDCFGSQWYVNDNVPRYALNMSPGAARSAASPAIGAASSLAAQAGGAQSATTSNGAAGGAFAIAAGAGGAGGSSSGTGGAGGAASLLGGAGAGTITGGVGGAVAVGGGAGGNGTSAGGSGGGLNLYSGAAGTGGTGTNGAVNIRQGGAAGTAALSVSTAGATTLASTVSGQNINITPAGSGLVVATNVPNVYSCGSALAANGACPNTSSGATAHIIMGSAVLSGSTSTITGISPAFTSTTTAFCVGQDTTTRANPVQVVVASASTITITNTTGATDTVSFICVGY